MNKIFVKIFVVISMTIFSCNSHADDFKTASEFCQHNAAFARQIVVDLQNGMSVIDILKSPHYDAEDKKDMNFTEVVEGFAAQPKAMKESLDSGEYFKMCLKVRMIKMKMKGG
jgi:hypothetical protein